jgi:hypothetical protein
LEGCQPFLWKSIQRSIALSDGPVLPEIGADLEWGAFVCYILCIGPLRLRGVIALTDI